MMEVEYLEGLRLPFNTYTSSCVIVSVAYRIFNTLQEEELMVRTSTASSSACVSRYLNIPSRKDHFQLFALLPVDTSLSYLQHLSTA